MRNKTNRDVKEKYYAIYVYGSMVCFPTFNYLLNSHTIEFPKNMKNK